MMVPQVAAVTCTSNKDVAAIHHRMGVLQEPGDIGAWMGDDPDEAKALVVPWPDGRLDISPAGDVDWNGPWSNGRGATCSIRGSAPSHARLPVVFSVRRSRVFVSSD